MNMKISFYIISLLIILLGSCRDDSSTNLDDNSFYYEFNEGKEWQYNHILTHRDSVNYDTLEAIIKVFEGEEKAGHTAYKFFSGNPNDEITPSRIEYGRTERDGLYYYYDSIRFHPSLDATLFKDIWIKQISFTEESWTSQHFEIDTLIESSGEKVEIQYDKSGERIGELNVDYKGKSYKALKCLVTTKFLQKFTINNEVTQDYNTITITEYIIIKDIGIYSVRDLTEDSKYSVLTELQDHK